MTLIAHFIPRKDMVFNEGTKILKKWVSLEGEIEITLTKFRNKYSVTTFLVEIPEEGEQIAEGEELVCGENVVITESKERALQRFFDSIPLAYRHLATF
jgi:glycine cleavage system H lipoate-binding protein